MHKSFIITEEDRNRILGMHENATKRQYLNERQLNDWSNIYIQEPQKGGVNRIISATQGLGTDNDMLLKGFEQISNLEDTENQLQKIWPFTPLSGYKNIEDMLKGEMEYDNESLNFMNKIKPIISKLGYNLNYKQDGDQLNNKSITITKGSKPAQQQTTTPTTTTPNTTQQTYSVPSELKTIEDGVIKFQTWMETNHKGWYPGKKPIDGKFGYYTNQAWSNTEYKNEFLKSLNTTSQPQVSNPYAGGSSEDDIES